MTTADKRELDVTETMELTVAAHRLGVSYHVLHRSVLIGTVPGRKVGNRWRVDSAAVERLAQEQNWPGDSPE